MYVIYAAGLLRSADVCAIQFRTFIDDLFHDAWLACQDQEVVIQAPSVFAGPHIAERLNVCSLEAAWSVTHAHPFTACAQIPFFVAFTMPFTRTRAYPNPFATTDLPLGQAYNYMSHLMVEQALWHGVRGQINRWRVKDLGLKPIRLGEGVTSLLAKVPYLYCFSPAVVPKPPDWPHWVHVTGYWFLDQMNQTGFEPPKGTTAAKVRAALELGHVVLTHARTHARDPAHRKTLWSSSKPAIRQCTLDSAASLPMTLLV